MGLGALGSGERVAVVSAILLFVFMFFHWFGVEATNTSSLPFGIESVERGKNAWEALQCIPVVLVAAICSTLTMMALRLKGVIRKESVPTNATVAVFGVASALLILFRIVNPPVFDIEETITYEGSVELSIFLALVAAVGITCGAGLAARAGRSAGD